MAENIPEVIKRLETKLDKQRDEISVYRKYYEGNHKLSFATGKYREEFNDMLNKVVDNWMPIVVDAVSERMNVEGFRFGTDGKSDNDAWDIWQFANMDADSELLHTETLITGVGYVMVWGGSDGSGADVPLIFVEDPSQVYVELEAGSRRTRKYAIKRWEDEWTETCFVNLYTPEAIHKFKKNGSKNGDKLEVIDSVANPLGVVNIVPYYNRPRTKPGSYKSEIHDVLSTQDQINKILCDAIVASEFAAFRQRWATGIEVEIDEDGKPKNPWESAINRILIAPDPDSKFGSFEPTELSNYTKMMENRFQSLASRTRTPPHYLLGGSGTFPSGETLKATETGLIAKTKSRMRHYGESHEEVMRLAFKAKSSSDKRANYYKAETIWADPESRTEAEHVDALVKLRSLNVPIRQLWEDAGYSQEQINRMVAFAMEEAMTAAVAQPSNIVISSGSPGVTGTTNPANS